MVIPFTVIKHEKFLDYKVTYDILVDLVGGQLPTEVEIGKVSGYLRAKNRTAKQVFVCFYLPGMEVGAGAFATAHHRPESEPAKIHYCFVPAKYKGAMQ